MIIVIDVREDLELKEKSLQSINCDIMNIPMRSIEFNKDYIRNLAKDNLVMILFVTEGTEVTDKLLLWRSENKDI